jgi:hypothetical protein
MNPNPESEGPLAALTMLALCAGTAFAQTPCDTLPSSAPVLQTRSVLGPVVDAQCNASMLPGLPAAVRSGTPVPGGGELRFVDGWQAQCELFRGGKGTGQFKSATVCAIGASRTQVTGVWKCKGAERVEKCRWAPRTRARLASRRGPRHRRTHRGRSRPDSAWPGRRSGTSRDMAAKPMPLKGPAPARAELPAVAPPKLPLPDLVVAAVREVPRSTDIDVVVRNVGEAPTLHRCWLSSASWYYDISAQGGPSRWASSGCSNTPPQAIPTLAPGQEATLRTCGYSREEVERLSGLWTRIQIDRECDPQRDGNNTLEAKRELSPEARQRENCAATRDLPECRK